MGLLGLGILPGRLHAQLPVWAEASSIFTSNQTYSFNSLSAIDSNGDVIVAGDFQSSLTFGTLPTLMARGASDIYVAKQDGRTHQWLWAVRAGSSTNSASASIHPAKLVLDKDDNVLMTGQYYQSASFGSLPVLYTNSNNNSRPWVAKLTGSNGSWVWASGVGGTSSYSAATSLAIDGAGNAIITGQVSETAQFGNLPTITTVGSSYDGYVAGLAAATGQWQWVKQLSSATETSALNVAVDATGNVVVAGSYTGTLTLGTLSALPSGGYRTLFVAKLAPATGQWLWATRASGSTSSTNYTTALTCSAAGDVLAAGYVQNGPFQFGSLPAVTAPAAYLARLDGSTGTWQWVKPLVNVVTCNTLALDAADDLIAGGSFTGTIQFEPAISLASSGSQNMFVSKMEAATGQTKWAIRAGKPSFAPAQSFGQAENTMVQSVRQTSAGDFLLAGTFGLSSDFGLLPTIANAPAVDGRSTYLARLSLTSFALTELAPARSAEAAPVAGPVTATYNQPLATTLPAVRVFGDQRQGAKAGTTSRQSAGGIIGNAVRFSPTQPFSPGELVSVLVGGATASASGAAAPAWVYQFRAATGGTGRGLFTGSDEIAGTWQSGFSAKGDLDNDGDLDFISAGPQGTGLTIGLNDGTGHFVAATGFAARGTVTALTLADADADGDLDVAWAAHYATGADSVLLRFNSGAGSFAGLSKVAVDANPRSLVFGDLDADGDLDLVASSYQAAGSVSVRLNNGTGVFSGTGTVATGATTYGVALGDVDNDGDLDLVATNEGAGTVATAFNNGAGSFGAVVTAAAGTLPHAIALADIDRDGDLDFVVSSAQAGATTLAVGVLASGINRFTTQFFTTGAMNEFALADINADGNIDLLTLDQAGRAVRTWLNTGMVGLFNRGPVNALTAAPATLMAGDLDGDGDVDWVTANSGGTLSPRFNTGLALAAQSAAAPSLVTVYPNPAHQLCTVTLPAGTTSAQLTLTNALGQQVITRANLSPQPDHSVTLDVMGIAPGLYHLAILTSTLNVSKALVIE